MPEPWASRLIVEGGGKVLVDERDLWPGGQFETTNLLVSKQFLDAHPKRTKALIEGLYEGVEFINAGASEAQSITNAAVAQTSGKKLADAVVVTAWPHMTFTLDLTLLDQVLREHDRPAVS